MVIIIAEAHPGMVLAEDVILPNGSVLMSTSQTLTSDNIETLKGRNISEINIVEAAETEADLLDEFIPAEGRVGQAAPPTLPKLQVVVTEDFMKAKLRIEPLGAPNEVISAKVILSILHKYGILHGINTDAINAAVTKWKNQKKFCEIDDIAVGLLPQPGKEGEFDFKIKCLTKPDEVALAKTTTYYWQYIDNFKNQSAQIVNINEVVAVKQSPIPPMPGKNIKGDDVTIADMVKNETGLDASVAYGSDGMTACAKKAGVPYFAEGKIGVIPINFDGAIEVTVAPDRMKAEAVFRPHGLNGKPPTPDMLKKSLAENQVTTGFVDDVIKETFKNIGAGTYPVAAIVVAAGTPAKNGENGKVKILFDAESSLKPKENSDGSVDYKNVSIVHSASKDQELAQLLPPTKGTPGKNIRGDVLPCTDGVPGVLPVGPNTAVKADNASILIATTDGNIRYSGNIIEIQEGYTIKGDVNFSTGNIKYAKTVIVNGDIKSGFKVECGGDLQVGGTIEDAEIIVAGNVLCKFGFIGSGKGLVDAKGDVNVGFMKNQTIHCRQNVVVAKEAINSTIFSRKTITIHGNPMSIAGGSMVARDSITVFSVGNASGIKTQLEVGLDFTLSDELKKTKDHLNEIMENKKKIVESSQKFEKIIQIRKKLAPKEEFLHAKIKNTLLKYDQQIHYLEEREKLILDKLHDFTNAFIKIEHSAMPGTLIKIGDRHLVVKDEIIGPKTIRLVNQEIRIL